MKNNIIDVIKYDGDNSVLVYKHPKEDFNYGSQLIVRESQQAVFFKDGKALDTFGPGKYSLDTNNIPFLKNAINVLSGNESIFHCQVYFINTTIQMGLKWGTFNKFRLFDPMSGLHLELGASGAFNLKIADGRRLLLKVLGSDDIIEANDIFGFNESYKSIFKDLIVSKAKVYISKTIREEDYDILEIDEHLDDLSNVVKEKINKCLETYGLFITEFIISTIVTPDDDPNFKKLKEQHAARYLKVEEIRIKQKEAEAIQGLAVIQAETAAKTKIIGAQADAEQLLIQGNAEAEVMKKKGYNYNQETTRIIGKAAAENSSGSGASIVSDMIKAGVGLGVGTQVAKNVSQIITSETWECPICHHKENHGKFCENCGHKRDA